MLSVWLVFPPRRPSDFTLTLFLLIFRWSNGLRVYWTARVGPEGRGRDAPQARSQGGKLINTHRRGLEQVDRRNKTLPPGQPVPTSDMAHATIPLMFML